MRSVVLTTLVAGTSKAFSVERIGQFTCEYMPGASTPEEFGTSNSTAIVRVLGSIERAMRATVPVNVRVAYAET
jgi:hypothetical protein